MPTILKALYNRDTVLREYIGTNCHHVANETYKEKNECTNQAVLNQ